VSRDPLVLRMYRAALHLYPRAFREEYGDDMVQLLRDQCTEESTVRVTARAVVDLAIAVPSRHLEARMHRSPNSVAFAVAAVATSAGVLIAALGGSNPATMLLGVGLAFAAVCIAVVAWRQNHDAPGRTARASWWKFLIAGPLLVGAVIVGAEAGIDAWYLGMVTVLAAVASTAAGLILGAVRLLHRG
jgi:hypothetical protein